MINNWPNLGKVPKQLPRQKKGRNICITPLLKPLNNYYKPCFELIKCVILLWVKSSPKYHHFLALWATFKWIFKSQTGKKFRIWSHWWENSGVEYLIISTPWYYSQKLGEVENDKLITTVTIIIKLIWRNSLMKLTEVTPIAT